jgi:hypothetical protein
MTETINIDQLTPEQVEALQAQLQAKQAKVLKEKEKAKSKYERERDRNINNIVKLARGLNEKLTDFKRSISLTMESQHEALTEYGEIRSNSKGGFSITSSDGMMRVTRTRDTEPFWDERGTKAVAMLKEFLEETAKKRDRDLFEILMGFLSRNEKGDLEYAKVFQLLKHRNAFADPRWTEGLNLLEESFQVNLRGYGYEIKVKDEQGKWQNISLNFTSL